LSTSGFKELLAGLTVGVLFSEVAVELTVNDAINKLAAINNEDSFWADRSFMFSFQLKLAHECPDADQRTSLKLNLTVRLKGRVQP
jgi:hypothetical protein